MTYRALYGRLQTIDTSNIQSTELRNLVRETVTTLSNDATNVRAQDSTVTVTIDLAGAIHLHATFYSGLKAAIRAIPWSTSDPTRKRNYCSPGEGDLERNGGSVDGGLSPTVSSSESLVR